MTKPIIGLTAGRRNESAARATRQDPVLGVPMDYVSCVERAGGAPVLLPRVRDMGP